MLGFFAPAITEAAASPAPIPARKFRRLVFIMSFHVEQASLPAQDTLLLRGIPHSKPWNIEPEQNATFSNPWKQPSSHWKIRHFPERGIPLNFFSQSNG
jgi:hypothetical protein